MSIVPSALTTKLSLRAVPIVQGLPLSLPLPTHELQPSLLLPLPVPLPVGQDFPLPASRNNFHPWCLPVAQPLSSFLFLSLPVVQP